MSSGFVKTISEGKVGTFVRYNADELLACQDNHQRMLEQTNQTEEQHRQSMSAVFQRHQQIQSALGDKYFEGAATRFPVETLIQRKANIKRMLIPIAKRKKK